MSRVIITTEVSSTLILASCFGAAKYVPRLERLDEEEWHFQACEALQRDMGEHWLTPRVGCKDEFGKYHFVEISERQTKP